MQDISLASLCSFPEDRTVGRKLGHHNTLDDGGEDNDSFVGLGKIRRDRKDCFSSNGNVRSSFGIQ